MRLAAADDALTCRNSAMASSRLLSGSLRRRSCGLGVSRGDGERVAMSGSPEDHCNRAVHGGDWCERLSGEQDDDEERLRRLAPLRFKRIALTDPGDAPRTEATSAKGCPDATSLKLRAEELRWTLAVFGKC